MDDEEEAHTSSSSGAAAAAVTTRSFSSEPLVADECSTMSTKAAAAEAMAAVGGEADETTTMSSSPSRQQQRRKQGDEGPQQAATGAAMPGGTADEDDGETSADRGMSATVVENSIMNSPPDDDDVVAGASSTSSSAGMLDAETVAAATRENNNATSSSDQGSLVAVLVEDDGDKKKELAQAEGGGGGEADAINEAAAALVEVGDGADEEKDLNTTTTGSSVDKQDFVLSGVNAGGGDNSDSSSVLEDPPAASSPDDIACCGAGVSSAEVTPPVVPAEQQAPSSAADVPVTSSAVESVAGEDGVGGDDDDDDDDEQSGGKDDDICGGDNSSSTNIAASSVAPEIVMIKSDQKGDHHDEAAAAKEGEEVLPEDDTSAAAAAAVEEPSSLEVVQAPSLQPTPGAGKKEEAAVADATAGNSAAAVTTTTTTASVATSKLAAQPASGVKSKKVSSTISATATTTTVTKSTATKVTSIVSLPLDSLHSVASFLTPQEWNEFGRASKSTRRVCREIIRRVRMHGFRCAMEIVTCWKIGQQADAKELAALYVQSGVPVYPASLGHAYHTLIWRMNVEVKEIEEKRQQQQSEGNSNVSLASSAGSGSGSGSRGSSNPADDVVFANVGRGIEGLSSSSSSSCGNYIDPFFRERSEFRNRENYGEQVSYVAEKCMYWMDKVASDAAAAAATASGSDGGSTPQRRSFRPPSNRAPSPVSEIVASAIAASGGDTADSSRALSSSSSPHFGSGMSASSSPKKIPIKIHEHLYHRHNLGKNFVNDGDGTMAAPPVSLSADFFHPIAKQQQHHGNNDITTDDENAVENVSAKGTQPPPPSSSSSPSLSRPADIVLPDVNEEMIEGDDGEAASAAAPVPFFRLADELPLLPQDVSAAGVALPAAALPPPPPPPDAAFLAAAAAADQDAENIARALPGFLEEQELDIDNHDTLFEPATNPLPQVKLNSILNAVELDVYSSSFSGAGAKSDGGGGGLGAGAQEMKRHLRSRFATYQRRLEAFLAHSDHPGFEECILDFWDEFFPHTGGIHYYDRHTPVPRISHLQKFLTKPCPKSIGIVQCEIERIKISTRGKGVNVKGRLFPTYEYRLFIRHHPINVDGLNEDEPAPNRRDTVLMVAKNRGRKHVQASGVVPASVASKKGSNNYYLYMPQQSDVDDHFNKINETDKAVKMNPNGASHEPVIKSDTGGSVLLGRLQSNFIGTEFQIFTPHLQKRPRRKAVLEGHCNTHCSPSEDELDYDSGVSSDNTASRRSRFGRLSLRRNSHHAEASSDCGMQPIGRNEHLLRASSSPDLPHGRHTRTSRRAIAANTPSSPQEQQQRQFQRPPEPSLYEAEDGAITYTANLLGSRPRIMDVCIPTVTSDGVPGADWKRYLESCDDTDEIGMLNCFKQLQQRLADEQQNAAAADDVPAVPPNRDSELEASEGGGDDDDGPASPDFGLMALQNRPPWWNIELGSFVLNFGGRVSVASVKNFQLCDRNDHDRIMLQFGRIQGRHSFTMDFQHPLTAVQAFSIAISSLQSKISFG